MPPQSISALCSFVHLLLSSSNSLSKFAAVVTRAHDIPPQVFPPVQPPRPSTPFLTFSKTLANKRFSGPTQRLPPSDVLANVPEASRVSPCPSFQPTPSPAGILGLAKPAVFLFFSNPYSLIFFLCQKHETAPEHVLLDSAENMGRHCLSKNRVPALQNPPPLTL